MLRVKDIFECRSTSNALFSAYMSIKSCALTQIISASCWLWMDADGKMDVTIKKIWEHAETAQLLFFNCKTHTRIQTSICFSSLYNLRQAFNFKTTKLQTA